MPFKEQTLEEFTAALASRAPVPGGGGTSALAGALGAALASMVANLTAGKKKYAAYEDDIQAILKKAEELRVKLLQLIDKDAEVFEPLSHAYGMPKDAPGRDELMEKALCLACSAPLEILRAAAESIELHKELAQKGSRLMISDVGVGAAICRAALCGANLSVFINTELMKDRDAAAMLDAEADEIMNKYCIMADDVYNDVVRGLRS